MPASLGKPGEGCASPRWQIQSRLRAPVDPLGLRGPGWSDSRFYPPMSFDAANEELSILSRSPVLEYRAVAVALDGFAVGLVPVIDNAETSL